MTISSPQDEEREHEQQNIQVFVRIRPIPSLKSSDPRNTLDDDVAIDDYKLKSVVTVSNDNKEVIIDGISDTTNNTNPNYLSFTANHTRKTPNQKRRKSQSRGQGYNHSKYVRCKYDHVFGPKSSQMDIYKHISTIADSVLRGLNATIFAYGQTGSGKTYTMFGNDSFSTIGSNSYSDTNHHYHSSVNHDHASRGIASRIIHDLFSKLHQNQYYNNNQHTNQHLSSFQVCISLLQVYNEQIYDMFADPDRTNPLRIVQQNDSKNTNQLSIVVPNLCHVKVNNEQDCLAMLQLGLRNRTIRETNMNQVSSRSHLIFQITIEQQQTVQYSHHISGISNRRGGNTIVYKSKLNLVDLAGSERWNIDTDSTSTSSSKNIDTTDQITELTNINSSLSTLGRCIAALAKRSSSTSNSARMSSSNSSSSNHGNGKNGFGVHNRYVNKKSYVQHIPYRDSKLTRLLQDSLGDNCITVMIATINPLFRFMEESISTLRFADRAHQVMTFAQVNEEQLYSNDSIGELQREILRLQNILQVNGIPYDSFSIHESIRISSFRVNGNPGDNRVDIISNVNTNMIHSDNVPQDDHTYKPIKDNTNNEPYKNNHRQEPIDSQSILQNLTELTKVLLGLAKHIIPSNEPQICSNTSTFKNYNSNNCEFEKRDDDHRSSVQSTVVQDDKLVRRIPFEKIKTTTMSHSEKTTKNQKPTQLSLLLNRRKILKGDSTSTTENVEEESQLEAELKMLRKQRNDKKRIQKWLEDKESKLNNPIAQFEENIKSQIELLHLS